jgi:hypothetical protein
MRSDAAQQVTPTMLKNKFLKIYRSSEMNLMKRGEYNEIKRTVCVLKLTEFDKLLQILGSRMKLPIKLVN